MNKKSIILFCTIVLCLLISCDPNSPYAPECITTTTTMPDTDWTVMIYSAGDRNLSRQLMEDLAEIKSGTNNNMTIIALADNTYNTNTSFSEAFSGTRLYQIYNNDARRLSGGDILPEITLGEDVNINTGDADTFRRFIKFCKTYYPAKKYAVFVGSHGIGVAEEKVSRSETFSDGEPQKAMAVDGSASSDWIFTAELTDAFDYDEPIDLFVLDCCNMGFAEIAYQYRPDNGSFNTKYMVASLPQQIANGLCYSDIFSNVTPTMSASDFGKLILQKQQAIMTAQLETTEHGGWPADIQSMALYDCSKVEKLKKEIDKTVPYLGGTQGSFIMQQAAAKSCGYWKSASDHLNYDYMYDVYNLFNAMSDMTNYLSAEARQLCLNVALAADEMVISSYSVTTNQEKYSMFENDKCGLAIFFPYYQFSWQSTLSYNSIDIPSLGLNKNGYGNFAWCIDGCEPSDNIADNWFELLDSWYDTTNDESGGLNYYQY